MPDQKRRVQKGISKEFQAELEEWMSHGIYEAAQNQWSMTSLSIPKEKFTNSDEKDSTE